MAERRRVETGVRLIATRSNDDAGTGNREAKIKRLACRFKRSISSLVPGSGSLFHLPGWKNAWKHFHLSRKLSCLYLSNGESR